MCESVLLQSRMAIANYLTLVLHTCTAASLADTIVRSLKIMLIVD